MPFRESFCSKQFLEGFRHSQPSAMLFFLFFEFKFPLLIQPPFVFIDRTLWIVVCQSDESLLATCGNDVIVNIFDMRAQKVVVFR